MKWGENLNHSHFPIRATLLASRHRTWFWVLQEAALTMYMMGKDLTRKSPPEYKALVSAAQLRGAQSARSFGLSASASGAQILIGER